MSRQQPAFPSAQRGVAIVLISVAMLAAMLVAALALDGGHLMLNKTRLQNTVDAAALAAAKALNDSGNTALATAEALAAFGGNAGAAGNAELEEAYAAGNGAIQVTVEYSSTLPPFTPGSTEGPYVRVAATGFTMPAWLATVGGVLQKTVSASAVAGPRTLNNGATVCNVAPMMVCGDAGAGAAGMWGYTLNQPVVLKQAAPSGSCPSTMPGNFQLVQLNGTGAAVVRDNMAGSYDACIDGGSTIETQPGVEAGPVWQGLNTRFGEYSGPMSGAEAEYPPDVIVTAQTPPLDVGGTCNSDVYQGATQITSSNIDQIYSYDQYNADLENPASYDYQPIDNGGIGAYERRVLAVPVGDCAGSGSTSVSLLGFACFFLLQPVQPGGDSYIFGQFIERCTVNGMPGADPSGGNGPRIIQLYRDPQSGDS